MKKCGMQKQLKEIMMPQSKVVDKTVGFDALERILFIKFGTTIMVL
jgi:hypothetical protein